MCSNIYGNITILKFRDLPKTQKPKNLDNETLFSSNSVIMLRSIIW